MLEIDKLLGTEKGAAVRLLLGDVMEDCAADSVHGLIAALPVATNIYSLVRSERRFVDKEKRVSFFADVVYAGKLWDKETGEDPNDDPSNERPIFEENVGWL